MHKSTDGPIPNYCNYWCHLSKIKSSRTQPNLNKCIHVDYSGLHHLFIPLFRMEFYSDQRIVFRLRRIYDHFLFQLSCSSTSNQIRSVHVNSASASLASKQNFRTFWGRPPPTPGFHPYTGWWKLNGTRFPRLAKLAQRYPCIAATSVPLEQLFFGGWTDGHQAAFASNPRAC